MTMFARLYSNHASCFDQLPAMEPQLTRVGKLISHALLNGNKILICGNGGSASDSQHFAAEIIGRFQKERAALPAISLTTDTSILTALANDYSFSDVFARQVEGLGNKGDILLGISTSGNSENILRAVKKGKSIGMHTVGLLGSDGGSIKEHVDFDITVTGEITAHIQETHIFIIHYWAALIEEKL